MHKLTRYLTILAISMGLQACGGGGETAGGGGGGGTTIPAQITQEQAARFLAQATFGPTLADIDYLVSLDNPNTADNPLQEWLDEQFAMPHTPHLPYVLARDEAYRTFKSQSNTTPTTTGNDRFRHQAWWNSVVKGNDQLRHRVALALSQILVTSDLDATLRNRQFGMTSYYDMLARNAFGNYRDLLMEVTLHPVMGVFLSSQGSRAATGNIHPDENYARELKQLFTIGVFQLNNGGELVLDNNNQPIATYTQDDIEEFARVFTGWDYDKRDTSDPHYMTIPMYIRFLERHDQNQKVLLGTTVNYTSPEDDLAAAIDVLMAHPNMGPFISKQLIQRLVTSNPTPAYVARVAGAFNDNGSGIKGDLAAVISAILLDEEARTGHTTISEFGKLREPLLRISHLWRTFKIIPYTTGEYNDTTNTDYYKTWYPYQAGFQQRFGQALLKSPSVFNFYRPDYSPPDLTGLVGPEFQIATENTIVNLLNMLHYQIQNSNNTSKYSTLDLTDEIALIPVTAGLLQDEITGPLLDHLNLLMFSGDMPAALRTILSNHLFNYYDNTDAEDRIKMARDALTLITASPEYLIQK